MWRHRGPLGKRAPYPSLACGSHFPPPVRGRVAEPRGLHCPCQGEGNASGASEGEGRAPRANRYTPPMQRLFLDLPLAEGDTVPLPAPAANYLVNVLRLAVGGAVRVFDDRTGEYMATLASAARRAATLAIGARTRPRETPPDLWLMAAPLKKGRIDWVAEKAAELGIARFVPVVTARTVVATPNLDRLRAHMVEAAEQCGRTALPELADPVPLARLLADWPDGRALLFADETGGEPMALVPAPAAILIGPEGGFTPEERAAIRAHPAARAIGLGPRILRADTAAVAAIALWQATSGDWGRGVPEPGTSPGGGDGGEADGGGGPGALQPAWIKL